jgi:hypothetical protein
MKIKTAIALSLAALSTSCSEIVKFMDSEPDRHRAGLVYRRIAGDFTNIKKYTVREFIPLYRAQANTEINENLDVFTRIDFIGGQVEASPLDVWAEGDLTSLGLGASYFPFGRNPNPNLSLDAGVEAFYSSYDMKGDILGFKSSVHDRLFGFGTNLGATLEYKCNNNLSFFTSSGLNFTQNFGSKANANFDGPYLFLGFEIKLP